MRTKFCRLHTLASGVALLIFSAAGSFAANAIPDAPTVPPAPVVERPLEPATSDVPGEQPSVQHQWVPGHWRWLEGAYVWEAGRWDLPPAANVVWQAPRWERQTNGYVLRDGYWDEAPPAPPTTVVSAPAPQAAPQEIIVTVPPPPPQREVIYERPSPLHIWIGGHWSWRLGKHVWVSGRWSTAPRHNAVWVAPRWEHRQGRYVYVEGYWRDAVVVLPPSRPAPPTQVVIAPSSPAPQVIVVQAPPPPRREVVYGPPGPGYVWISGYWAWQHGRHVWVAGHYQRPPRGHRTWVEPRWERRGGNYIYIEGRWGN
jgi:hypothetical protein